MLLVVSDEASPSGHPAESPFDDPASRQYIEPVGCFDSTHNLDGELRESRFVYQLTPVVGTVCEEVLDPGPAFVDRLQDQLRVGDVRGCQIEHEQAAIGIHSDVALASGDRLVGAKPPPWRRWRFDRLAIDDAGRGACLTPGTLAGYHHRDVVDRVGQEAADKLAESPVDRLPGLKVDRQHLPAAARPNQVADRVHHLPQIRLARAALSGRGRQRRRDHRLFLVGHVHRVVFEPLAYRGRPPSVSGVHIHRMNHAQTHQTTFFKKTLSRIGEHRW